jgi:tetrahydromethanopterin S-methyltransferase subunit G
MEKSKLKELVKQVISEYLDEMSTSGAAGGYLTKYAFKPKELDEAMVYRTPKAFGKPSKKEQNTPAGFEKMPKSGKAYTDIGYTQVKLSDRLNSKDLWDGESLNEARYSTFKKEIKTRTPQQQLHEGVKAIQRRLDEINRLVEFTSRMKAELKENDEGVMYLERTRKSLTRINEKIQEINEKINNLTE